MVQIPEPKKTEQEVKKAAAASIITASRRRVWWKRLSETPDIKMLLGRCVQTLGTVLLKVSWNLIILLNLTFNVENTQSTTDSGKYVLHLCFLKATRCFHRQTNVQTSDTKLAAQVSDELTAAKHHVSEWTWRKSHSCWTRLFHKSKTLSLLKQKKIV